MDALGRWLRRVRELSRAPRVALVLALTALGVAALTLWLPLRTPHFALRVSAGDDLGRRHDVAETLARLGAKRGEQVEREVLELELQAQLDLPRLLRIQRKLGALKNEALEGYGEGKIGSADLLNSFLAHVTDVRAYLNALILHERERLEKKARRTGEREDDVMRELWAGALEDLRDE